MATSSKNDALEENALRHRSKAETNCRSSVIPFISFYLLPSVTISCRKKELRLAGMTLVSIFAAAVCEQPDVGGLKISFKFQKQ